MKSFLSILFLVVAVTQVYTQDILNIEYESYLKFDVEKLQIRVEGAGVDMNEIKRNVAQKMKEPAFYSLILNKNESEFKHIERISNDQTDGFAINLAVRSNEGVLYKDFQNNFSLKEMSFLNSNYLVKDSIKKFDWKISKDSKELLGYEVRKAEVEIDSITTAVAWYAPKLNFKNGPDVYDGLPGLILEIQINKENPHSGLSTRSYSAISVTVDEKNKISLPKKGKEISKTAFEEMRKEQMEKRKSMFADGVDKD
ncbi:GLPGLI family protein [Moheibacter lacus]|uniref:GLPGLI family protein n=1 Tax=Moheibacter lacus TaxID=2745851 RepID=A0A838ZU25_9FLAO|nr:GLPGLI family protein [Moheibacter lacus]MBA5630429.1 GLPGLI family protein [Moheibacter lacus]